MKHLKFKKLKLFFIIFLCSPAMLFAQDVNKIIAKHIKAHGGVQKWEAVKTMKISGEFTAFSVVKDFTTFKTSSGLYYSDLFLGQHRVIEAFDGEAGWTIDPWQDILFPRKITKAEANVFYQKAEFCTPFFNYEERGDTVKFIETTEIEGVKVNVIKLSRATGGVEMWYLDAKTHLEYKCESMWVDFAFPSPTEIYFENFRTIEGLVIPFYVEKTFGQRNRVINIKNIEINTKIDESMFVMPKSKEIKKLEFLVGEWDVTVEFKTRSGRWYPLDQTTSAFEFVGTNILQEKISYDRFLHNTKIINYTYDSETKQYRMSVFNDLSSSINIFDGVFDDDGILALDNTKISYSDEKEENKIYTQYSISNIETDSFVLEIKTSSDNGETWKSGDKFTYKRM